MQGSSHRFYHRFVKYRDKFGSRSGRGSRSAESPPAAPSGETMPSELNLLKSFERNAPPPANNNFSKRPTVVGLGVRKVKGIGGSVESGQQDVLRVRTIRLLKATGFTFAFSGCCYVGAAIWQHESRLAKRRTLFDPENFGYVPDKPNVKEYFSYAWEHLGLAYKLPLAVIGLNILVCVMWKLAPTQLFMMRHFTCNLSARKLSYFSLILSSFSHQKFLHLYVNSILFYHTSSVIADQILGIEQFTGFCLSAMAFSNLSACLYSILTNRYQQYYGLAGAIYACTIYFLSKYPNAGIKFSFLPSVSIPCKKVMWLIICSQMAPLIAFGFFIRTPARFFYATHIGGSLFGWWYCKYGEKMLWGKRRQRIVNAWSSVTGRK